MPQASVTFSSSCYLNHQLGIFGLYLHMIQCQKLLNISPWSKKTHAVHVHYFFLNHRRQQASRSDLLILFAVLGFRQRKPQDLSSFIHQGRNSHPRFPAQATQQGGGEANAAQRGDRPPRAWQPTGSWWGSADGGAACRGWGASRGAAMMGTRRRPVRCWPQRTTQLSISPSRKLRNWRSSEME